MTTTIRDPREFARRRNEVVFEECKPVDRLGGLEQSGVVDPPGDGPTEPR